MRRRPAGGLRAPLARGHRDRTRRILPSPLQPVPSAPRPPAAGRRRGGHRPDAARAAGRRDARGRYAAAGRAAPSRRRGRFSAFARNAAGGRARVRADAGPRIGPVVRRPRAAASAPARAAPPVRDFPFARGRSAQPHPAPGTDARYE